jgi:GH15 family glucan-1,4-alpha-glucosidase
MKRHIANSVEILKKLQHKSGLFSAASSVGTGYNKAWIRDTIYEALALEKHSMKSAIRGYWALLDILLKHEDKIDWAIKEKPDATFKYIHARYDPVSLEEFYEEWGNKQHDAIGALLFHVGRLGSKVLRSVDDFRIVQKLVFYLQTVEYWHDADNGIWEEYEEVHCSSVGACVAGLKSVSGMVYVPAGLIAQGERMLDLMLPSESWTKDVDLALLSLIYPYNIVSEDIAKQIVANVESELLRSKGVIRYIGDQYYSNNGEAEWTFGLPWLAICHRQLGNMKKYEEYLEKSVLVMNDKGEMPELYTGGIANDNTPLGWSQGMFLLAVEE